MLLESGDDWRLPTDVKIKWLHDLRSGHYVQARNQLAVLPFVGEDDSSNVVVHPSSYCCLGVAYFGSAFNKTQMPDMLADGLRFSEETDAACAEMQIPPEVQKALVDRNDDQNWNFFEIADWIEENL